MTKTQALDLLLGKLQAGRALGMAGATMQWDAQTTGVPEKSLGDRGMAMGWLQGEMLSLLTAPDTHEAIQTLEAVSGELNPTERAMVRELGSKYKKLNAVPPEEYKKYSEMITKSMMVWETAREKRDYDMMLPYYEKIFEYQRRLCDWFGYEKHPYDALLDDYDKGSTVELLDGFFSALREKVVPLFLEIVKQGKQPTEIIGSFDIEKQRALMPWLAKFTGYDLSRGKVGEVEHPFCMSLSHNDVRITTKYHENSLQSALFSTIHECGHAIYQQNMGEELYRFGLADGASCAMHESQSRLYENMICRSKAFAGQLLPKLREQFDYFNNWDEEMLYRAVNVTRPSLIRIEADELTYSLHVMVRYELEKAIISGDVKIKDLPQLWSDKYQEFIGVRPNDLADGVLQDCHWAYGLVGYFPSYAVGTAFGAQLLNSARKVVDIDAAVKNDDLSPVTEWLKENVHGHGEVLLPDELLKQATGEEFNPNYYADYLTEKFTELYLK